MPRFASRFARQYPQVIFMLSHHGFFDMEGYRLLIGKRERCLS
jgi:UDP-N-acetyl-D-mannosaminuronic acid transferase (WecB/TagA/CpsF family)